MGSESAATRHSQTLLISAGLAFANLVVVALQVLWGFDRYYATHQSTFGGDDFTALFLVLLWGQAFANGAVLLLWPSTRRVGLGILLGTVGTIVAFALFLLLVVAPAMA